MRIAMLTFMLCAVCMLCFGCATPVELEDHAYALVMGVDRIDDGLELTIRVPRIGDSGDDSKDDAKGGSYLLFAARGASFNQALEALRWLVERDLNLSQLKLLVISDALTEDASFQTLISDLAGTRHINTATAIVVCDGSAKAFVKAQEVLLGTRLSADIVAMLQHLTRHGFIPRATLADMIFAMRSGYSDPVVALGVTEAEEAAEAASLLTDAGSEIARDTASPTTCHCLGAGIFRDGILAYRMDAEQTLLLNLLCCRVDSFARTLEGWVWRMSSSRRPSKRIRSEDGRLRLEVRLELAAEDRMDKATRDALEAELSAALTDLIRDCQEREIDPFGFAECAASRFMTIQDWRDQDWRSAFSRAEIAVTVHISSSRK